MHVRRLSSSSVPQSIGTIMQASQLMVLVGIGFRQSMRLIKISICENETEEDIYIHMHRYIARNKVIP